MPAPMRHGRARSSEQALVARAGKGGIDPNIRGQVNTDTKTIADSDKSFIDSLIFWQDPRPVRRDHRSDQGAAAHP